MDNSCRPFIDFIITKKCNYACPYCSQSKAFSKDNNDAADDVIDGFLIALSNLKNKNFEITITGGEPLLHDRFFEVIEKISKMGYKLSIVSNLSAPVEKYYKIIDILGESLSFLMFSIHTNSIGNLATAIDKVKSINSHLCKNTKLRVCAPLWNNLDKLKFLHSSFYEANIDFEVQHVRLANGYVKYNEQEEGFLSSNSNLLNKNINTFGKLCYSGCLSAVIYEDGEIYRCYSSRFIKSHSLGNIKDGKFNFYDRTKPCPLFRCTCPKPYQYNMISDETNYVVALKMLLGSFLAMPSRIFSKRMSLQEKLFQKINLKKS